MGKLIVGNIDINQPKIIKELLSIIDELVENKNNYYPLNFKPPYYFMVSQGQQEVPSESGWYVILEGKNPIYAGKADNLCKRLNTTKGSVDNFANDNRNSELVRNFIKKFAELNILVKLRVCVITERDVLSRLKIKLPSLTELDSLTEFDRGNIEKMINIFRCCFNFN